MGILWRWLYLHSFLGDTGSLRSYQLITVGIEPRARKKKKVYIFNSFEIRRKKMNVMRNLAWIIFVFILQ